jgi:hypothetical protein
VVLDRPTGFAQRLELGEPLDREATSQRKPGPRETERMLQIFVGKAGTGIRHEGAAGREHGFLPRRADRARFLGHTGEHLCHVTNLDAAALAMEFASHVQKAAEIAGHNRFGPGRDNVGLCR